MARPKEFNEEQVLERAVNVFWCRGYEATSVQDLVDGLGINRASLYDTYGDKFTLYQRALDRYRQTQQAGLCLLLDENRPALDVLAKLLSGVVGESVADPDHKGCFIVNAAMELANREPNIATLVATNQRAFEANLQRLVERGQAEGAFTRRHPAAELARYLFGLISGLKVLGKTSPDAALLNGVISVAMRAILIAPNTSSTDEPVQTAGH